MSPPGIVPLGRSGVTVDRLIPSSWSFAGRTGPMGGNLSAAEVERAYLQLGLRTFVVTPRMPGTTEAMVELIAAGLRDTLTLITVAGLPTAHGVERGTRKLLARLGTDRIDVLLMGWVQKAWYLRRSVWAAMQRLKDMGLVRAVGFSAHDRLLAARLHRELEPAPDVLMIRYNAAHRGAERELFDGLPDLRPGVIAYTATRWGELIEPPEGVDMAPMTAPECYRFVLGHRCVDAVLCGARSFDELAEDVGDVSRGTLSDERIAEVLRFGDLVHAQARRSSRFMFRQG